MTWCDYNQMKDLIVDDQVYITTPIISQVTSGHQSVSRPSLGRAETFVESPPLLTSTTFWKNTNIKTKAKHSSRALVIGVVVLLCV